MPGFLDTSSLMIEPMPPRFFLLLVHLAASLFNGDRVHRRFFRRYRKAFLRGFLRASSCFAALLEDALKGFEENKLQIEVNENQENDGRHCLQQKFTQVVRYGIHDFERERTSAVNGTLRGDPKDHKLTY